MRRETEIRSDTRAGLDSMEPSQEPTYREYLMARRTSAETVEETVEDAPVSVPEPTPADAPETVQENASDTEDGGEGKRRKPLAPLDFSAIRIHINISDEMAAKFRHTKSGKERDADQQATDDLVSKSHGRWVAADRPADWAEGLKAAGMYLKMREDQLAPLKARIQRAGTFHGVAIRFGQTIPSETEGHVETVFYAKDKPVKGEPEETDAES